MNLAAHAELNSSPMHPMMIMPCAVAGWPLALSRRIIGINAIHCVAPQPTSSTMVLPANSPNMPINMNAIWQANPMRHPTTTFPLSALATWSILSLPLSLQPLPARETHRRARRTQQHRERSRDRQSLYGGVMPFRPLAPNHRNKCNPLRQSPTAPCEKTHRLSPSPLRIASGSPDS